MATEITISPRVHEVMTRFIDTHYGKVVRSGCSHTDGGDEKGWINDKYLIDAEDDSTYGSGEIEYNIGKFRVAYEWHGAVHECGCDNEGITINEGIMEIRGDECDCHDRVVFTLSISYKTLTGYTSLDTYEFSSDMFGDHETLRKQCMSWIGDIDRTYTLCRCSRKAVKGDWCINCYLRRYIRTEEEGGNCCVCLENEGRWTKLHCGHILHYHCYQLIKVINYVRSCPLCREPSKSGGIGIDPYDE